MAKAKKLLFLRFSSLGDVIFANYSAMRIKEKHPEYRLTWVTDSLYAELVRAQPWVDDVIEWDRKATGNRGFCEILKKIRREGFDILVDMHGSDRSSLFSLLSGIAERYCVVRRFPLTHNAFSFDALMDTSRDISECPRYLHVPAFPKEKLACAGGEKKIGLAIGASFAIKRWPVERWTEFCRLAGESECSLWLIGAGSDDEEAARAITEAAGSARLINTVGRLSVAESISLTGEMDAVVSGDTGIMHAARALGVPVVGLIGPNFPGVADGRRYTEHLGAFFICGCPDAGCRKHECGRRCLYDIGAEEVWRAASRLARAGEEEER